MAGSGGQRAAAGGAWTERGGPLLLSLRRLLLVAWLARGAGSALSAAACLAAVALSSCFPAPLHVLGRQVVLPRARQLPASFHPPRRHDSLVPAAASGPLAFHRMITYRARLLDADWAAMSRRHAVTVF